MSSRDFYRGFYWDFTLTTALYLKVSGELRYPVGQRGGLGCRTRFARLVYNSRLVVPRPPQFVLDPA